MLDIQEELRKLDPQNLTGRFPNTRELQVGDSIQMDDWDSMRMVTYSELSDEFIEMQITANPAVPVEITCPSQTYWLIVPVKFPTTPAVKKMHLGVVVELGDAAPMSYGIRGEILPVNLGLVPEGVIAIMGDFYAKN